MASNSVEETLAAAIGQLESEAALKKVRFRLKALIVDYQGGY